MNVALSDAKAQLAELVRRAEAGEDVILTRHGQPAVQLVPIRKRKSPEDLRSALTAIMEAGQRRGLRGDDPAARSQDFLYDEDGLPG